MMPAWVPGLRLLKLGNFCLPALGWVALPTATIVKKGHYSTTYQMVAQCVPQVESVLPATISDTSKAIWTFLADNARTGMQLGMGAAIVGLPFLGLGAVSAGLAVPLVYGKLEQQGYVPLELASSVEKFGPTINTIGLMMTGPIGQLCAVPAFASHIPGASQWVHQKIESKVREKTFMPGPSLEQYDRPWNTDVILKRRDILDIVNGSLDTFATNPAHFGKQSKSLVTLEQAPDLDDTLLRFAEQINWERNYKTLYLKFKKDERLLVEIKFESDEKQAFDQCVEAELQVKSLSDARSCRELLIAQFYKQLKAFVDVLQGLRPHIGSASDLLCAKENTRYIVPYISKLGAEHITTIDILLALAIEGGEYCALGLKNVTQNIVEQIRLDQCSHEQKEEQQSDEARYKSKIFASLQTIRDSIVTNFYEGLIKFIGESTKAHDAQQKALLDVHTVQFYRRVFTLGFSVLTAEERDQLTLAELYQWFMLSLMRQAMTRVYLMRMQEAIQEHKDLFLYEFLRNKLASFREQNILTDEDIEIIDDLFARPDFNVENARQLFFCLTGILFPLRSISEDYDEITAPKDNEEDEDGCILVDY
jgi:hypothetical protein